MLQTAAAVVGVWIQERFTVVPLATPATLVGGKKQTVVEVLGIDGVTSAAETQAEAVPPLSARTR
jgi:hypothetical protein